MAEGRSRDRWNHTAAMLALTANCHRAKKSAKVFKTDDFHPHFQTKSAPILKAPVSILKRIFVENRKRG